MAKKASSQDALNNLIGSSQAAQTTVQTSSPAIPVVDQTVKVSLYLSPSENRRLSEKYEIKRQQVKAKGRKGRYSFSTFLAELLAEN